MKEKQVAPLSPANLALLDLGVVLGQTQAFGMIAGRCTAAQALGLKRLREEKLYKSCVLTWEDFCRSHLKISKAEANRTIQLFDEFGPDYFDLSALTRISPETYRAIAPAVKDGAIHFNGEAIPLKPENSRKVSAAVAELRRTIQFFGRNLRITDRIVELDKRCSAIVAEFEEIARDDALLEARLLFNSALSRVCDELGRVALQNGVR
jgi:hypothetical protein